MTDHTTEGGTSPKGLLGGLLGKGRSLWVIAVITALLAVGGALSILSSAAATTTYYVLSQNVPARTQITEDMLLPVQTSLGGQPRNALDIADVRTLNAQGGDGAFALVALRAGDVLSTSTVGPLDRISADLPSGFVAASFSLDASDAVAGKVRKGDYIDIIAVLGSNTASEVARVVLHRVLVLDVTVSPSDIASAATSGQAGANLDPGPESAAVRGGIPSLYTVGLAPSDAATLALVRENNLMVVLSSNDTTTPVDASSTLTGLLTAGTDAGTAPADAGN